MLGSYFSKSGFLCNENASCRDPITGEAQGEDKATRSEAIATLSVTPFSFLEAYMSVRNSATANTNGSPELLQVVGDTSLGVKGYMPADPDSLFYFGGDFDLMLMTGTGGVGIAGGATSVAFHALATMDLNNRTNEEDRIPFRAHLNLGYKFDNSGNIVDELENTAPPEGRGVPIERTERFGLGINRVDAFQIGLAAEYVNPWFRPFMEWTLDVPLNRQDYICNIEGAGRRGDLCMGARGQVPGLNDEGGSANATLKTSPSRLTLGARGYPWEGSGLSVTAALDIGTGATGTFLEEVAPEAPYSLWFALGYAIDTAPPEPEKIEVAPEIVPTTAETRRYILGRVTERSSGAPIPQALIRYDGVPMTGLVADANGEFFSQDLPAGDYKFKVFAEQFREGSCTVSVPDSAPPEGTTTPRPLDTAPLGTAEGEGAAAPAPSADTETAPTQPFADADGNVLVPLNCQLDELPRIANVTGLLVDSASGGAVPDATVTITDKLNRSLKLDVDAQGSFQFRNVPFGSARLTASAPGYMTTITPINIETRDELKPHLLMNARPEKLGLNVGKNEITLDRAIKFVGDTAGIAIDSMSMLEELALALTENTELTGIEIQVHTDDSGAASYSRRISQERADNIRQTLIHLGVRDSQLKAKGYGPDQPLAPNVSEANRARNNRVQIVIQGD